MLSGVYSRLDYCLECSTTLHLAKPVSVQTGLARDVQLTSVRVLCCRLQHQLKHQEKQLQDVDDLLSNSSRSWCGGRRLPTQDLLGVLLNRKSG